MKISIIIPVLNEENSIAKLLEYLLEIQNPKFTKEIIKHNKEQSPEK